ncbi:MAG: ABC transporter permease [Tepidisphaeraceae bacterium]|jgi:ABC-2 type transport system permease protein
MKRFSPLRTWAIGRKEFLHVFRDPWSLGLAIVIPMLLLLLFGYALTLDVDRVPLIVWDQSQSQLSRDLVSRFSGSRYFAICAAASDYQDIERAIDTGEALAGLVVPREFAADVSTGRNAPIQMIFDGSDPNTATLAMGYASVVVDGFSQGISLQQFERKGGRRPDPPLDLRSRVWFNAELESRNAIVPGLIAISMMVIAALLTSLTVAREWERGTMEQLISTPVKGHELILGKLLPYFVIGMLDMLLVVLVGQFLFQVPLRGNVAFLFAVAAVFLIGVLSLGILISVVTRSQLLASQLAMIATFLPAFLLSGFMYPIASMPRPIQVITCLIPARYFVELLRAIYLKGVGLRVLGFQAGLLAAFGVVVVLLAILKFRKKLV